MALVKMYRDEPEVLGGNTTADIPEEAVNLALDNGWKIASKAESHKEVKAEAKSEPKQEVKEEKVEKAEKPLKTEDKKEDKTSKK